MRVRISNYKLNNKRKLKELAGKYLWRMNTNPLSANVIFLHPMKMPENQGFSDVFRGYRNGTLA